MMFATSGWVSSHPATAEAIDLAWIAAAKQFDNYRGAWAANAYAYTNGTNSYATLNTAYAQLKAIGGFGVRESSFSRQAVAQNFTIAKTEGTLTPLGNRPLAQIVKLDPWTKAWGQYSAHKNSFS
jgi:hypothetical protein